MKRILKKTLLISFVFFVLLGIISALIQRKFYGYIDENNILQDSIFLPIAAFSVIIALLLFIVIVIVQLISFLKKLMNK